MKKIQFISVTIIGSLIYLFVGWFVFDFILGDFTNSHTTNLEGFKKKSDEFSMLFLYLSCLSYSFLINYIQLYQRPLTLLIGFKNSMIIGICIAMMTDFYWYASSHFFTSVWPIIFDVLGAGLTVGILGMSITWIHFYISNKVN